MDAPRRPWSTTRVSGGDRVVCHPSSVLSLHVDPCQPELECQRDLHLELRGRQCRIASAQPSHLFETPADQKVYTIQLHATSTYGCEDHISHDVEVHATPLADVEVVQEEGCYPLNVTFANLSTGGDQFEWNYGTGLNSTETASEHTVAYFNPTSNVVTYPAVLTVSTDAGCSSQDVTYVEVLPEVEAQIEGGMSGALRSKSIC